MLPDVRIVRSKGGLGRQKPTEDGISGLITQGVAVSGKLALDTNYKLRSLKEAEALGIDVAYDTTNESKLHYHLSEFFRMSQGGIVWLRVVARTVTMAQMADKTLSHATLLLDGAAGEIKQLGICLNSAASYSATTLDGLDADVIAAIPKAEALAVEEFAKHRPVHVLLGGHGLSATISSATDLRTKSADNVSIVIGTDKDKGGSTPAVGAILGTVSYAAVHESIGWLDKFPLSSDGSFLNAGLSNGKEIGELLTSELEGLNDKGYIFAMRHTGYDGFFWNDSHSCTGLDSDYAYIENNRTMNKAARVVRQALLPLLKGPIDLETSGKLTTASIGYMESKGLGALQANMSRGGEISDGDVYIDPDQDILGTGNIDVQFSILPVGVGRNITATIGFVKSIQ